MKRSALLLLPLLLLLCACGKDAAVPAGQEAQPDTAERLVVYEGESVSLSGSGMEAQGTAVTLRAPGTYRISGSCPAGQLVVDTGESALEVRLILEDLELSNAEGPALLIQQAKDLTLELRGANLLCSGTEADKAAFDGTGEGAALYAEDDLTIRGEGSLRLLGYRNNGLGCKDDLSILSGSLEIVAANNGLRASESLTLSGGSVSVSAGNDGVKTSSAVKPGKGFIHISGGTLSVEAAGDALSAESELRVSGGTLRLRCTGDGSLSSSKAMKSRGTLSISGGLCFLESREDGLRSESDVEISGGTITVSAVGDGLQAGLNGSRQGDVRLSGGSLTVFAGKQALQAEGALRLEGDCALLALSDSNRQAALQSGGQPFLLCPIRGLAGDQLSIDGLGGTEALRDYKCLLYADAALPAGKEVKVSNGRDTVPVQVR